MTNQAINDALIPQELYDIVITRARVFNGYEALPGMYDVGISGREIAAVSTVPLAGRREVNGAGKWLLPGLIDTHLHFFDFRVVTDPESLASLFRIARPHCCDSFWKAASP